MRPVTQTADVDVKRQSKNGVKLPSLLEMGSIRRIAPRNIIPAKPKVITSAELKFLKNVLMILLLKMILIFQKRIKVKKV